MAGAHARAVNNTPLPHQFRQLGDVRRNAPGLRFPLQIEVAKFRRRIRFTVFGKVYDHNVRVAYSEHLHRVSQSVGRVLALG